MTLLPDPVHTEECIEAYNAAQDALARAHLTERFRGLPAAREQQAYADELMKRYMRLDISCRHRWRMTGDGYG